MGWLKGVLIVYGLFLIGAGLEGYLAKKSLISLMAGGGAGLIVLFAVWLVAWKPIVGYLAAMAVAVGMIGMFLPRFIRADDPAKAVWPALAMVVVSALVVIALTVGHFMAKKT